MVEASDKLQGFARVIQHPTSIDNLVVHSVVRHPTDSSLVNCEMTMESSINELPKRVRIAIEGIPMPIKSVDITFNGEEFYAIVVKEDIDGDEIRRMPVRVIEEE